MNFLSIGKYNPHQSACTLISHLAQSNVRGKVRPSDMRKASGSFHVGGRFVSRGHCPLA